MKSVVVLIAASCVALTGWAAEGAAPSGTSSSSTFGATCPARVPAGIGSSIARVAAPNLRWAASTALLLHQKANPGEVAALVNGKPGLWLAGAPAYDIAGTPWTMNAPLAGNVDPETLAQLLASAPDAPTLLDGVYADWDGEYLDARVVAAATANQGNR